MERNLIRAAFVAGAVSAAGQAGFVGMEVDAPIVTTSQGGNTYYAYRVYAKFNNANDTVLNVYGMNATPAGLFWHNDFLTGGQFSNTTGTWSPTLVPGGNTAFDSWVTVGGNPGDFGNSTAADPNWGAAGWNTPGIAANAGWFNQNPPNLQGRVNGTTLRTLIAQFVFRNTPSFWTSPITIGFNQGLGTPAQFATGVIFHVPSPGAVALLGLAGLAGRRRRA